ncbi:MAG: hypothetical protein INH41_03275 [Myxococcaceae bacterium]|nr:hypothetical protein [Myxococcaceae bacterium]MCA3011402.1 hypothetical protein [Myxococcaceae bacterium]
MSLLDVAAKDPEFIVWAELSGFESLAGAPAQPPLQVGTRVLAPAARDKVRFERLELRYSSRPNMPGVVNAGSARETVDVIPMATGVGQDKALVTIPLLGRLLVKALNELPPTSLGNASDPTTGYDLSVNFQLVGSLSQSGNPLRTDSVTFPIRVVKSEVGSGPGAINCGTADTRLAPYSSAVAPAARACNYFGVGQRFTPEQCCSNAANANKVGCEPL